MPPLEVVCDRCGQWRDPATALVLEEIIVETRAEVEAFRANQRKPER